MGFPQTTQPQLVFFQIRRNFWNQQFFISSPLDLPRKKSQAFEVWCLDNAIPLHFTRSWTPWNNPSRWSPKPPIDLRMIHGTIVFTYMKNHLKKSTKNVRQ